MWKFLHHFMDWLWIKQHIFPGVYLFIEKVGWASGRGILSLLAQFGLFFKRRFIVDVEFLDYQVDNLFGRREFSVLDRYWKLYSIYIQPEWMFVGQSISRFQFELEREISRRSSCCKGIYKARTIWFSEVRTWDFLKYSFLTVIFVKNIWPVSGKKKYCGSLSGPRS